jgi:hypothetical protein
MEVGATFADAKRGNDLGINHDTDTLVNAKYRILNEGDVWPAVAVGVTDLFDGTRLGVSFYAVGSKTLRLPSPLKEWSLAVHGGIGSGIYDELPFAGAELGLGHPFTLATFGLPLKLIADWTHAGVSGAARVSFPFGLGAELGTVDGARGRGIEGGVNWRYQF